MKNVLSIALMTAFMAASLSSQAAKRITANAIARMLANVNFDLIFLIGSMI